MDLDALQDQLRLRARRWGALLDGESGGELRRSPLRIKLLEDAWQRFRQGPAPESPRAARRALTEALRAAWLAENKDLPTEDASQEYGPPAAPGRRAGHSEPLAGRLPAVHRTPDAFSARHLRRLNHLAALEAGLPGNLLLAWDTVLTAAELRPSAVPELGPALQRAAANRADPALRRRLQTALVETAAGDPGPYLRRQGVRDAASLVAGFFDRVEEALIFIAPAAEAESRLRTAVGNLRRWDEVLAGLHARLAARRDGDEQAQAVVARFLEPRIIAAYASLPALEIERVALVAGRNLMLSTLVGPELQPIENTTETVEPSAGPEAQVASREQWERLFGALDQLRAEARLSPQELLFLWLAPALGAGEAWRISGGDLAKIGSANYHQKRCMDLLHARVGAEAPWQRPPNPGRPDAHTRGLVGLLALRDGPDPFLERAAGLPEDARRQAPPPSDAELLTLLRLFNLGPAPGTGAGALVARCLRLQRWDEARRKALAALLAHAGTAAEESAGMDARTVAFLLTTMILGLPGEATRVLDEPSAGAEAWPDLVRRWLAAEGPGHEVIEQLRRLPWPPPAPDPPPPKRPVEREARLRQHLRSLAS